jgi:hypothetical protein
MIDSGATGIFISRRFVNQNRIATCEKNDGYELIAVDGSSLPDVDSETIPLPMAIQQHHEEITLDVLDTASHDVVLGMPWLEKHNPVIDWTKGVLRFARCDCVIDINPIRRQRSSMDDRAREINSGEEISLLALGCADPKAAITAADIARQDQASHKASGNRGSHAPLEIPQEYQKWKRLFEEEEGKEALPKHQPWDHEIKLVPGKEPTFGPIYALSEKQLKALRQYLDENLAKGFIRKSESRAAYPILFVPKKDGTLRLCVDYRKLNDITIKNRYPLPNIEELQQRLQGARWFTSIDLRGAYNLIRMKAGEEWKTAFRTRYGLYEYLVMPFGLTNAPATCQDMINDTLREYLDDFVVAYLDDILVYTRGALKEHIQHVHKTFAKLFQRNLKVKPEKCKFHRMNLEFLGFIVGRDGIQLDPDKIKSIWQWPQPKTVRDVQAFLGLANYNRKFIENYSKIATPLTELTKKDIRFHWTSKQEQAFHQLKLACQKAPVLRMFDPKKPLILETDASDYAIGACATQEHDGKRHPIAYYSRKMSPAEQNYDIHDKELLAIVSALQHWRIYCEGAPKLTIYTDHKNLLYFTTTKVLNGRQTRWSELLGQYKFEIKYTPGKDNARADALSRRSDYVEGREPISHAVLKVNQGGTLSANPQEFNATLRILRDDEEEFPIEQGKFKVPEQQVQQCIQDHHDNPTHGHPGVAKTLQLLRRRFTFPDMRTRVTRYIKQCVACQQNKSSRHPKYGNLLFSTPPVESWEEVTMDFITKLPPSIEAHTGVTHDTILVIVDRLTKYTHFIPCKATLTAEQLGFLVLDRLIRYHGIPKAFVTDRDKLFTSAYWRTLVAQMGIHHKLSSAFHPETDGQTERTNQTLEAYLRHYVNNAQDNWVSLLPMAQLAINNHVSETTKSTPFFANFGKDPQMFRDTRPNPNAEAAQTKVNHLRKLHGELSDHIKLSQSRVTKARYKTSKNGPQLKKGDKVYLLTKNLKTRKRSRKLDHVKVGPFLIAEQRSAVSYRLQLPKDARIHPVFHISLLEPADPSTPLQTTFDFEPQEEEVFEVEKLLERKGQRYLVRWKDYPPEEDTWETASTLENCQDMIREFNQQHPARPRGRPPRKRLTKPSAPETRTQE